jgi:predicted transcriptional regulator of viral defense system
MKSQNKNGSKSRFAKAIKIFRNHGGILRTAQAIKAGIHPGTLYEMRDSGALEMISRGVFRLSESPPLASPDLVTVATRVPNGVICLISALSFYELTTQIPHEVHVALSQGAENPRLDYPPIKIYRFGGEAFTAGVEIHNIDSARVRIYSPEKTLADCFKFRNKVGLDTVIEAVRFYRERRNIKVDDLMNYAAVCRVSKIIRPYLEAIL